jgi:2-C-methyl-D-erythritol 4-phosphate cytidylyltransferase/2-C-methyl-D-erythritol 2,4-cyclodiphosphate synthase
LLAGKSVVRWSVEALLDAGAEAIALVIPAGGEAEAEKALAGLPRWFAVPGGAERAQSVRNGLQALAGRSPQRILVHDAARPFLTRKVVDDLVDALEQAEAALPVLPVADTLKRAKDGVVTATVPRDDVYRAQTPQAFRYKALVEAHAAWDGAEALTDDALAIERAGGRVLLTAGDPRLMKLTYPEDFEMAEALAGQMRELRVGQGLDAHRFGPGDGVWLCGVQIAHDKTLIGHSDADAGLHALTDAILGAIGEGDIGDHFPPTDPKWKGAASDRFLKHAVELVRALPGDIGDHFPPTDPKWKGAASDRFLKHAVELVRARGGRVVNVDVTLVCEQPKIKPHREAMRARLSEILELPVDAISVKATTLEKMGFTGREEGLAAQAVAMVEQPRA